MELLLRTFFLMGLACFMLPALQKDGTTKKIVIQAGDKKISFNADYRFHCTTLKDAFEGSACSEPITCNALQNSLPLIRPFFKKGALYTCDKLKKSLKKRSLEHLALIINGFNFLDSQKVLSAALSALSEKICQPKILYSCLYDSHGSFNLPLIGDMKRVLAQSMFQQMPGLHLQLLMYQMSAANPTGMPKTVFKGYTQRIDSLCFSPNNLLIATACLNGTIHLWDILNARLIRKSLTGQTAKISSLCFSPDSSQLVCGSEDRLIRIWDVATYTQLEEPLKGHLQAVRHLCFSPNATYLASSSDDKTILIWNFATRRIHASYSTNSENAITCLCFNPNSNQIAIGFNDGGILLWYFNQDFPHKLPTPNKEAITSLCYNAQGTQLVASSDNFTVHIWDTNKHTHATKRLPYAYLENAQFVSNDTALITTSLHDLINIWNVSNPAKPFMILPNFCTHTEGQLSPDCRYVAATYGYPRRDTIILTQLTDVDLDKWLSQTIKPEQIAALSYIMNRITQLKSINLEKYFSLLKIPLHEKLEIFLMNATAEQNRKQPSHDWVSGDGLRD